MLGFFRASRMTTTSLIPERLRQRAVLHADETPVQQLDPKAKSGGTQRAYLAGLMSCCRYGRWRMSRFGLRGQGERAGRLHSIDKNF